MANFHYDCSVLALMPNSSIDGEGFTGKPATKYCVAALLPRAQTHFLTRVGREADSAGIRRVGVYFRQEENDPMLLLTSAARLVGCSRAGYGRLREDASGGPEGR